MRQLWHYWRLTEQKAQTGWQQLRSEAPSFALCLLFAPTSVRELLSDLFRLALECEAASERASEPILAIMRLTALSEMMTADSPPAGNALLSDIHRHKGGNSFEFFEKLPDIWIRHLQNGVGQAELWGDVLTDMFRASGPASAEQADIARQVGYAISASRAGTEMPTALSARSIHSVCGADANWLLALNAVSHRAQKYDISSDTLLIFRLFWLVLRRPDRSF